MNLKKAKQSHLNGDGLLESITSAILVLKKMSDLTAKHEENGVRDCSYTLEIQSDNIEDRNRLTLMAVLTLNFIAMASS